MSNVHTGLGKSHAKIDILRIPPGTFHRSISDPEGSLVLNQAVRYAGASVQSEFRVYNSGEIPRLLEVTTQRQPEMHGFKKFRLRAA